MSGRRAAYPEEPYQHRADQPHVAPNRPISQGDVFVDIPLIAGAIPDPKQRGT